MGKQHLRSILCGLVVLALSGQAHSTAPAASGPKIIGCSGDMTKALAEVAPVTTGPLSLETVDCADGPTSDAFPETRVFLAGDDPQQLAIVKGNPQVVLQTVSLSNFTQAKHAGIYHNSAQVDRQGRVRAVFSLYSFGHGASYQWTQDQLPKQLPYVLHHGVSVALAPDGKRLLVQHNLSASGAICEDNAPCPRTSRNGTIADLRDVDTGRVLWEIKGTAADISQGYAPVVSPDGRYAIITLPSTDERVMNSRGTLALISMVDGTIVQHLNGCPCDMTANFSSEGKKLEVRRPSLLTTYGFDDQAR